MTRSVVYFALASMLLMDTVNTAGASVLGPVKAAAAVYEDALDYIAAVGCYTDTSAAKLDLKELKSQFESYRMEHLKVNRTTLDKGSKKDLKDEFKKKQKTFAAAKRALRTKKRAAKLGGKTCFWTRNPTPPPTQPPTEPPTPPPTSPTWDDDYMIHQDLDCAEAIKELQPYHYITGDFQIYNSNCNSIELNLLKGIGGLLQVDGNKLLTTINVDQLQTIGGDLQFNENALDIAFNAGQLETIETLQISTNPQLSTFNATKLKNIRGNVWIFSNPKLGPLGLDALEKIGTDGDKEIYLHDNTEDFCPALENFCKTTEPASGEKCSVTCQNFAK